MRRSFLVSCVVDYVLCRIGGLTRVDEVEKDD